MKWGENAAVIILQEIIINIVAIFENVSLK